MPAIIRRLMVNLSDMLVAAPHETAARPTDRTAPDAPNESTAENIPTYSPSPADVGEVRAILKATHPALPTEIADIVLDFADYSVKDIHAFNPRAGYRIGSHGPAVYGLILKGPQIRELKQSGGELRDLRIKAVRFEIASHDQGWGGEAGTQGTYHGAFSWFEATILRRKHRSGAGVEPPPNVEPPVPDRTYAGYSEAYRPFGWDFAADEKGNMLIWPVQKNKVAVGETETHEIVWMLDGDGGKEHEQAKSENEDTGSGSGNRFVRTLQPGDVICLWARAIYPGWANVVEKAKIEVTYSD
ncbi:uncharacterized protein BDCG_08493 [Blastomyces dermatitidis ER-3]|uniref:Ankyrin repeat protein n=1 Tax=Ajellomyces dermatitidis (strain ER-3 / ATCC MYA-2586) TaxID=559297 RepID=A0ABP2EPT1_AJEDR|nr:uncharacterized protein BDCG_08493 [Blastomyces dermatitidis ER-3]EEQ85224.1 hypothetical protein BDCG_08493 [Blastomyces dermatitidis ER-3]EQL37618.1 hypothetical protein BDFG_01192 [Blastomyces dermatitidis ATCC 26199]